MKKILLFILIVFLSAITLTLHLLDKKYFICPIKYKWDLVIRNDGYGEGAFASARSGGRTHDGIDLLADVGEPVLASRSGIVIAAGQRRGMGKYVIIRHNHDMLTIYGHLSRISVSKGQRLRQGEVIGRVGKTGNANYRSMLAHLHFEIRKAGVPQDPLDYL